MNGWKRSSSESGNLKAEVSDHENNGKGAYLRLIRYVVDAMMTIDLIAIMATALVEEVFHEWLGMMLFVLMVAHIVLSRRRILALVRGKKSVRSVASLVLVAGIFICMIALIASSLVLSKYAFGWLPALPGASWARQWHMVASYWLFVLAFIHVGMGLGRQFKGFAKSDDHGRTKADRHESSSAKTHAVIWWVIRLALIVAGAAAFTVLNMGTYMTMQVRFAFADPSVPLWIPALEYLLVGAGFASLGTVIWDVLGRSRQGLE